VLDSVLKLLLSPLLIALVSLAQRRFGPVVGALLVSLPLTSGPVLFFLAHDHGPAFAAAVARNAFPGLVLFTGYDLGYAALARTRGWPPCLAAALGCFAGLGALLRWWSPPALLAAPLAVAAVLLALRAWPRTPDEDGPAARPGGWDLPLRMGIAAFATVGMTGLAPVVGSQLAGLVTQIPLFSVVLTVFTHRRAGPATTIRFLRTAAAGLLSCVAFYACLALTLVPLGPAGAFSLAAASAVTVQAILYLRDRAGRRALPVQEPAHHQHREHHVDQGAEVQVRTDLQRHADRVHQQPDHPELQQAQALRGESDDRADEDPGIRPRRPRGVQVDQQQRHADRAQRQHHQQADPLPPARHPNQHPVLRIAVPQPGPPAVDRDGEDHHLARRQPTQVR
jgi:hypothetical protein